MARLGTVYVDVEGDFSPLQRQAALQSARVSQSFARSFGDAQRRNLQQLATTAKWATGILTGLTTAMAVKGVKAGIQLNAQFESATAGIATFTGNMRSAERHIERLRKVSAQSPLRLTSYVEASRTLQGFGLEAEKAVPLLDAVNKAIVATGGGEEEMKRVVLALGQIQARGKVAGEEVLQLAEAGVPVQKILQKELGLTGEQIGNIGNEGIKASDALAAIARGWNREYGAAYENAAETFNMQTAALVKNFEQVLRLSTEPLFKVFRDEWLPVLNATAQDVIKIWQRKGLTPEERFERSFEAIRDGIGPLLDDVRDAIDEAGLDEKLLEAFNDFIPKAAEAAARGAGKAAEAFAIGFAESDIWGKLVLGTVLVRRMGLGQLFWRRQGAAAGAAYAAGLGGAVAPSTVAAGGLAAGGLRGRARGLLRGVGRFGAVGTGVLLADQLLSEFARQQAQGGGDPIEAIRAQLPGTLERAIRAPIVGGFGDTERERAIRDLADQLEAVQRGASLSADEAERLRDAIAAIGDLSDDARAAVRTIVTAGEERGRFERFAEDLRDSYERAFNLKDLAREHRSDLAEIRANFGRNTKETRELTRNAKRAMARHLQGLVDDGRISMRQVRRFLRRFGMSVDDLPDKLNNLEQSAKRHFAGVGEAAEGLEGSMRKVNIKTKPIFKGVETDARKLFAGVGDASEKADKRTRRKTKDLADGVERNIDRMVGEVSGGLGTLRSDLDAMLSDMGLSPVRWSLTGQSGGRRRRQRKNRKTGGPLAAVVPGEGVGDRHVLALNGVPIANVESKEGIFVGNRNLMAVLEQANKAVPRFQTGGLAGGISKLANSIAKRFGLVISSGYRPGDPGHHGQGLAADIAGSVDAMNRASAYINSSGIWKRLLEGIYSGNPPLSVQSGQRVSPSFWGASTWAGHADHLHLALSGAMGPVAQQLARLTLQGPEGPLREMGQAVLDRARRAANRFLTRAMPKQGFESSGGLSKARIASIWRRANPKLGNANLMAAIALAESSGIPTAVGHDPGGTQGLGLWQITTGFNDDLIAKYGGRSAMFNPLLNAKAAGDILRRQGLGAWVVYNTGAYRQFLQKGGMALPSLDRGGRVTKAGIAEVHPGDVHRGDGQPVVHMTLVIEKGAGVDPDKIRMYAEDVVLDHANANRRHSRMGRR